MVESGEIRKARILGRVALNADHAGPLGVMEVTNIENINVGDWIIALKPRKHEVPYSGGIFSWAGGGEGVRTVEDSTYSASPHLVTGLDLPFAVLKRPGLLTGEWSSKTVNLHEHDWKRLDESFAIEGMRERERGEYEEIKAKLT